MQAYRTPQKVHFGVQANLFDIEALAIQEISVRILSQKIETQAQTIST
jgi:hypothetical protein